MRNCYVYATTVQVPSSAAFAGKYNIWLEPYFSASKQRNIGTYPGYRSTTSGFILGIEKDITETFNLGIAAGYAYTSQKSLITSQTHANINNYVTTLYGTNKFEKIIKLDWSISGGQNYYNAYRVVEQSPETIIATSDYIGVQYTANLALSKTYIGKHFDLLPQINSTLIYAKLPEYSETNAGSLGNTMPENISTQITVGAGIQAEWPSLKKQQNGFSEVHALVFYDVSSQMFNLLPNSVIGTPALSTTTTTYKVSAKFGGSFKHVINEHISIKAEYDLQLKRRYYNNIFFLIFKYIF